MKRIDFSQPTAIYGGSFDPVHLGHLHVAHEVMALKPQIKQFVFVPTSQSPGKHAPYASEELRLAWLEKVCANNPQWYAWDFELRRPGPSFTVNTLFEAHDLGASKAKLFLVLGADTYSQLSTWKQPEMIRSLAKILVVERPGYAIELRHSDEILKIPPHPASSTVARKALVNQDFSLIPEQIREEIKNLCTSPKNPYPIGERSNG